MSAGDSTSAVGTSERVNAWDAALVNGFSTGADVYDSGNTASRPPLKK